MTIILVIAAVCVYDLCGLLAVLYINHTDRMDTVDGTYYDRYTGAALYLTDDMLKNLRTSN